MGNTTLVTGWINKTPGIPFDFVKPDMTVEAIVIVAPWSQNAPALERMTVLQQEQILDLATHEIIKYYHPTMWYVLYGGWSPPGATPSTSTLTPEAAATHTAIFAGNQFTGGQWVTPTSPQPTDLWELKEYLDEQNAPPAPVDPDPQIIASNIKVNIRNALQIEDKETPARPGSRPHVLITAKPGWASMKTGNFAGHGPYPQPSAPSYSEALGFWNQEQGIYPFVTFDPDGVAPHQRALILSWPRVGQQLQTIKTLFTKYHNQARRFDGQIVPNINFEDHFRGLESVVGRIGELLKLNGYVSPGKQEDQVTIYINELYQIVSIEYFQPSENLSSQPVKVGQFPYSAIEPFRDFQSILYLSRWDMLLDLIARPPGKKYEVFINFIKDLNIGSSSHLKVYSIEYCASPHTPLALDEIEAANELMFGAGIPLIEKTGYMSPGDDTLHMTFPGLAIQNKMLQDPTNRGLILNDQFAKLEERAEDFVDVVSDVLREIKNDEGLNIVKDVLHKVGIDRLIIEAIRCLTYNTGFNPNDVVSDVRDLVSATSELFAGRKRPMSFDFPEITVKIPVFSVTGTMQETIKTVLLEALLGAAAALVEALMEMIKEACKPRGDSGDSGDYGALDLSNMFETDPSPNKAGPPDPLGAAHGLNVCFKSYQIPDAAGMRYLADVSTILTPTEICQLLRGSPTDEATKAIKEFNLLYEEPSIRTRLHTTGDISSFFKCLGDMVDIDSICQTLIEELIPAVDDLCITEEQVLSAVDTFNLNNLLDMLENGIVVDIPKINLTCPTKPGYIPNPLVEHSIPQLISSMAEVIGVTFYLSVDGIKTVLLTETLSRQDSLSCLVDSVEPLEAMADGGGAPKTEIMKTISEKLRETAEAMAGGIDGVNELMAPCNMDIEDVFHGIDDLEPVLGILSEIFSNLDLSGMATLGDDLDEVADSMATRPFLPPRVSRVFPKYFKENVKNLVPSLEGTSRDYLPPFLDKPSYRLWPNFAAHEDSGRQYRMRTENGRAVAYVKESLTPQLVPGLSSWTTAPSMKYRFKQNAGLIEINYVEGPGGEIITDSVTGISSDEQSEIRYRTLYNINHSGNKFIYTNEFSGPRVLTGDLVFKSELYNADDLENNLGLDTITAVEQRDDDNPAQTAFANMITRPFKDFVENFNSEVDPVLYEDYFDHLKDSYYHSTHAGLTQRFGRHAIKAGRFTTKSIAEMLLTPDNSNCDPDDPRKVGDLIDINGIVKDVQDEYNESACSEELPVEEAINKCILFGTMLLFLQVSITKFYLQNVSVLSAFKLDEIMRLSVVREFVTTTTFDFINRWANDNTLNILLVNTMGVFSDLFRREVNGWMTRKLARGTALEENVLIALELDPVRINNRAQSAENYEYAYNSLITEGTASMAIKYLIAWRMERCALPISNVIANPDAMSLENVFISKVIGFDTPFMRDTDSGNLTGFGAPSFANQAAIDAGLTDIDTAPGGQQSLEGIALYINNQVPDIENLLGYGSFKIEPWLAWGDATTTNEEEAVYVISDDPLEKISIFHGQAGSAPLRTLIKAHRSEVINDQWMHLDMRLIDARVEYRLVYYPPLELNLPPELLIQQTQKFRTLSHILGSALGPAGEAAWGNYRAEAMREKKAFMPISLGSTAGVTGAAAAYSPIGEDTSLIGTSWSLPRIIFDVPSGLGDAANPSGVAGGLNADHLDNPDWIKRFCVDWISNIKYTDCDEWQAPGDCRIWPDYDPETGVLGAKSLPLGQEYWSGTPPTHYVPGFCQYQPLPSSPDENNEPVTIPPADDLDDPSGPAVWSWHNHPAGGGNIQDEVRIAGEIHSGTDDDLAPSGFPDQHTVDVLVLGDWEIVGPTEDVEWTPSGWKGTLPAMPKWIYDHIVAGKNVEDLTHIGHWRAELTESFLDRAGETWTALDADTGYITTSIPIMTLAGQELGELGMKDPYTFSNHGLADPNNLKPRSLRHYRSSFKESPDYSKFEYFFSKIMDKDSAFVAMLMNSFCLTEDKHSTGMKNLFSDTLNGAAGLFMTTLLIGARTSGHEMVLPTNLPGIQNAPGVPPPFINVRTYVLKALREMPIIILKALCELLDPHVLITKIIKDVSGQAINQAIDAMEMGITIAEETSPEPIQTILKAIEVDPEAFVEFAFCQLNKAMRDASNDLSSEVADCKNFGDISEPDLFNEISPFPTFTLKGVNLTGTIPGIFMMPPGPFGIVYLILRAVLGSINLDPDELGGDRPPENSSCE